MASMRRLAFLAPLVLLAACGGEPAATPPPPAPTIGESAACMLVEDEVTESVAIWADPNTDTADLRTLRGFDAELRDVAARLGGDSMAAHLVALADANADLYADGDADGADFRAAAAEVAATCGL